MTSKASVEFLQKVYPSGPWCLTAIQVDKKAIETRTFFPKTLPEMLGWVDGYNGERNLYWHINPVIGDLKRKADREHILSMNWLHVDIDFRVGEDPEEEQKRSLALLTTNLPRIYRSLRG